MAVNIGPPSNDDELILGRGNIRITRSVAQFGNTSYAINVLGSIRVDPPQLPTGQKAFGVILIWIAVVLALALGLAIYDSKEFSDGAKVLGVVVLVIGALGVAIRASAKPGPYSLMFRTSSGDVQAYAFSQNEIFEIKEAIESALHMRA